MRIFLRRPQRRENAEPAAGALRGAEFTTPSIATHLLSAGRRLAAKALHFTIGSGAAGHALSAGLRRPVPDGRERLVPRRSGGASETGCVRAIGLRQAYRRAVRVPDSLPQWVKKHAFSTC